MATKKQKREAALAKREVWLAKLAEENLIALAKSRAEREARKLEEERDSHAKHYKFQADCEECSVIRARLEESKVSRPRDLVGGATV